MEVSEAYVSLLDLPDTISDIMQFDAGFRHQSAFSNEATQNRIRRFYFYPWQTNEWQADYTQMIQEFMIQGSHYESEWVLRSVHKSP